MGRGKDDAEATLYTAVKALDNILDNFIYGVDSRDYKRAVHSAAQERSVGLGAMGYHGLLMSQDIPFESVQARALNKIVFSTINKHAKDASVRLADERVLPRWW